MTYYLGFDVAKAKLDYSLVNEQGIEQTHGKVANTEDAITALLTGMGTDYPGIATRCVVESTSTYHQLAAETAHALGVECLVINPIITKQQLKATIRGKKTDRSDALLIARLGLRGEGRLYTPEPYRLTKHLARSVQKLSIIGQAVKCYSNHVTGLLGDDLGSEAQELLQDVREAITRAKGQLQQDLATSARSSDYTLLQTITGVGPYTAASLMGEIQDISNFTSGKALIAFAGLDPKVRQSGKALNSMGRLTKRGSPYLRRSLFIAASVARQYDPQFKALYEKKRAEGKSYKVATCVVARKLLQVIRAVWLSGQPYTVPKEFT